MNRPCLHMDALQIDGSKYTHLHFAFGTITPDYQVTMGDQLTEYEFHNFKRISGPAKILSFGGWDFSTGPSTYTIFRQGVLPANRLKLATNIANFIKYHNLDGVDIDWEYPAVSQPPVIKTTVGHSLKLEYVGPGYSQHPTRGQSRRLQLSCLPRCSQKFASREVYIYRRTGFLLVLEGFSHSTNWQDRGLHHLYDIRSTWSSKSNSPFCTLPSL